MTRAILCVVERFTLGLGLFGLIFAALGIMAWLVKTGGELIVRKFPGGKPMPDWVGTGAVIAALIGLGSMFLFVCYVLGTGIAHRFGLCRMGA